MDAAADRFSAFWEEIDRSESCLVCSLYEEAASIASVTLRKIREYGPDNTGLFEHNDELFQVEESAGMVLVQSLNELGRASDILSVLKELYGYPATVPAEVLLTGVCFQISAGSLNGVKEFLEDFLSKWILVDGRFYVLDGVDSNMKGHEECDGRTNLDVETFLAVVEFYAVTLLGKHLKELKLAISWVEKAALPDKKRQVLLRRLHSMYSVKSSNGVHGSSVSAENNEDIVGSLSNLVNVSEGSSKATKTNSMPNAEMVRNRAILDMSRHKNRPIWWFRGMNVKFGNMQVTVTNGKTVVSCIAVLLWYVLQKRRAALKRYVLSMKKSMMDLWELAFSYQVNPLAAVQNLPAATRPGR